MAIETQGAWGPQQDTLLEESQVDIREYFRMLRRRWWLAALVLIACVGSAAAVTVQQTKIYEARVRLFVGQPSISRADIQFAQGLTQTSLALVKSYSEAIKTLPIAQDVATRLQLLDDPETLVASVSAGPVGETQIIKLGYRSADPRKAQQVANTWGESFIDAIKRIDQANAGGEQAVKVTVLEPASLPVAPVSPQPMRNGAAAVLLGGVLAWGVVLLAERLDSSIKGRGDAEDVSGLPVLSMVPLSKATKGLLRASGSTAEAFKLLRTAVKFAGGDDVKVIGVTSPESTDGKTTSAYNLASAYAQTGAVTVLVEADMRKPSLARDLGLQARHGLSAYLTGRDQLKNIVQQSDQPKLHVVPAGPTPSNPPELLGGERMGRLLRELAKKADVVIIDTPPVLAVSDALALTPMLDASILVVRAGKTNRERLREAMRVLGGVGAPVVGLVFNAVGERDGYYGYYAYGRYGYGNRAAAPSTNGRAEALPDEMRTVPYKAKRTVAATNGSHKSRKQSSRP